MKQHLPPTPFPWLVPKGNNSNSPSEKIFDSAHLTAVQHQQLVAHILFPAMVETHVCRYEVVSLPYKWAPVVTPHPWCRGSTADCGWVNPVGFFSHRFCPRWVSLQAIVQCSTEAKVPTFKDEYTGKPGKRRKQKKGILHLYTESQSTLKLHVHESNWIQTAKMFRTSRELG